MIKETRITQQDVTILKAYSSEFGKLPAKNDKVSKGNGDHRTIAE